MTDPVVTVALVNPIPRSLHFYKAPPSYPGLFLVQPSPNAVMAPLGPVQDLQPSEYVAAAAIIQSFKVLSEAVLAYSPTLPGQPALPKPSLKTLEEFKGALLKLQAEIKIAFENKPPTAFPKEFLSVFVQITALLEQVEVLIKQEPPNTEKPVQTPQSPILRGESTQPPQTPQSPVLRGESNQPTQTPQGPVSRGESNQPVLPRATPLPLGPNLQELALPNSPPPREKEPPILTPKQAPFLKEPFVQKPNQEPTALPRQEPILSPVKPEVGAQEVKQPVVQQKELPKEVEIIPRPILPSLPPGKPAPSTGNIPPPLKEGQPPTENPPLEELQKNIPILIQSLVKALPAAPKSAVNLQPQFESFIKEPVLTLLTKEVLLPSPLPFASKAQIKEQPPFQSPIRNEIIQPPKVFVAEPAVIQRTYPNYVPGIITPAPIKVAAPINVLALPLSFEVPFVVGNKIVPHMETVMRTPPFSTEIPFAFIVPYTPAFPIITSAPSPMKIKREVASEGEEDQVGEGEMSIQLLAYVPEGPTWYGDPFEEGAIDERPLRVLPLKKFAIGVYLVTNEQFVEFLNAESKNGKLHQGEKGFIFSAEGKLLCQVKNGNPASDIEVEAHKRYLGFKVTEGKESYPIICVTYFGAASFCESGGFRLPTEVEWEKAASIIVNEERNPTQKFRYGFSQDAIDASLASYGANNPKDHALDAQSTPVGFYNGKNICTKGGHTFPTSNAVSPFGCYDMSGNVWEWTTTADGENRIIKGGCFQSSEKELRASARAWKKEGSLDKFTGFRVAIS